MRDGIIYDCPNANCRTPIYTGKCSKACIEKYSKEMGIKPKTNADRIRAMSDEELARQFAHHEYLVAKEVLALFGIDIAKMEYDFEKSAADMLEQLQQPAEGE